MSIIDFKVGNGTIIMMIVLFFFACGFGAIVPLFCKECKDV